MNRLIIFLPSVLNFYHPGANSQLQSRSASDSDTSSVDENIAQTRNKIRLERVGRHFDAEVASDLTNTMAEFFGDIEKKLDRMEAKIDDQGRKTVSVETAVSLETSVLELREGVQYLNDNIRRGALPPAPTPRPRLPANPRPQAADNQNMSCQHWQGPYAPRLLAGPGVGEGQFLLGGKDGFVRSKDAYVAQLKEVRGHHYYENSDRGRQLCLTLARAEFSEEILSTSNVTGSTRNQEHKKVNYPKLDKTVLEAIFAQARIQFPGFVDYVSNTKCKTVKSLNSLCKHQRQLRQQRDAGANPVITRPTSGQSYLSPL